MGRNASGELLNQSGSGDRAAHLARDLGEGRDALLERRVIHEELARRTLRTCAGMMKNALIPCTWRRSWFGISVICDEIFCSALIRYSGAPVISAEPRSAAYSR